MEHNQVKEKAEQEDETSTPILLSNMEENTKMGTEKRDLHTLAYVGYLEKVRQILNKDDFSSESLVRKLDTVGMTPIHNAALGGGNSKKEIVTLLIQHDLDDVRTRQLDPVVNIRDARGRTPLHYAVLCKHPELVRTLITDFNADPNIMDEEGCSSLHLCSMQAFSEDAVTCLEILLKAPRIDRYKLCSQVKFEQSAVHLAAGAMADKIVKCLLNNEFRHSTVDQRGLTPLHLAVCAGDTPEAVSCVKELLRACDVEEANTRAKDGQTALHMASYRCHYNVLKTLLEYNDTDIWIKDVQGRTALHWATEAWFRSQSLPCVKLLVECDKVAGWREKAVFLYGENDGVSKQKGETAMDIALRHKSLRIAEYLIQAHPTPEAWLDDSMMMKIWSKLPEAMIPLMDRIGITYSPAKFHERNESIDAEFGLLTGFEDPVEDEPKQETKYLQNVLYSPKDIHQSLLLHPLVQIFIDLKWKKIRHFTWLGILFQFCWMFLYTILLFEMYYPDCTEPSSAEGSQENPKGKKKALKMWLSLTFYPKNESNIADCDFNTGAAASIAVFLYIMSVILIVKEIFQMKNNAKYFNSFSNYAHWTLLLLFFINSWPALSSSGDISKWQIYLAALGVFIGWMLMLREIAKFPNCGIYSAILKKVFWHCLKMILFYAPLLLAFGFCLRLLLPGKGQYTYVLFAIIKVVIMMTGELEFEDEFYEEDGPKLAMNFMFAQFVFLLLVFMTTIVLLNLLTGLAVYDVESLIEQAEINRLSNQLEQTYLLESLLLAVRKRMPNRNLWLFHSLNVTSLATPDYHCFASKKSDIEIRSYAPDLRRRIKSSMVPIEDN